MLCITAPEESHGDILYVFEDCLTVDDVSVIHPGSSTYVRSAAHHDATKIVKYRLRPGPGRCQLHFCAHVYRDKYGRLDAPLMDLVRHIGCEAAECSDVAFSTAQIVSGVPRERSVCLCTWNPQLDRAVAS